MAAHPEDAEARSGRDQGVVDSLWAESSLCPISLRRRPSRAREDGGDRRAEISGRRSSGPWIANGWNPGRGCCEPAGGAADRLAGAGLAAAGEICPWPLGPEQAGVDAAAGCSREAGLDAAGRRWRCLDMVTAEQELPGSRNIEGSRFLDLGTSGGRCLDLGSAKVSGEEMPRSGNRCLDLVMAGMPRPRNRVPTFRKTCLHLGSACPVKQTVRRIGKILRVARADRQGEDANVRRET